MTYVYESPDQGRTIYRRAFGGAERELLSIDHSAYEEVRNAKLWQEIREAAKTDPALKEMMDQVKTYYLIKKDMP